MLVKAKERRSEGTLPDVLPSCEKFSLLSAQCKCKAEERRSESALKDDDETLVGNGVYYFTII